MAEPVLSPDGRFLWNGSEWIPASPESESSINDVDNNQKDLNLNYKIIAILVSVSTFFAPYLGTSSPFSIFFQNEVTLSEEVIFPNLLPIEAFLIVFTITIAAYLPVVGVIFSIISLVLIKFKKSIKLLGYVLAGLSSILLFLIVSTYWFANYDLNDIGLGLVMLILSSLVISVKGDCDYDT